MGASEGVQPVPGEVTSDFSQDSRYSPHPQVSNASPAMTGRSSKGPGSTRLVIGRSPRRASGSAVGRSVARVSEIRTRSIRKTPPCW